VKEQPGGSTGLWSPLAMASFSPVAPTKAAVRAFGLVGAEDYLATRQGEFREKGIEARSEVVAGPVVQTIIDAAIRHEADLIAMASHGRSGLARVFYGSVAAGVLHRADRPLLLIRSVDHG
jgi:nucleotide-binding universal stress UspA family protein